MEHETHEHKEHVTHEHPPKKAPTISLPAAIITGAVIIGIAIVVAFGGNKAAAPAPTGTNPAAVADPTTVPKDVAKIRANDYVRGDKNAEIVVIEYSDSDCPFCQRFHPVLEQLVNDYKGKVAWVYRFFPLDMHPNAYTEAISLECVGELAGNNAFQKYLDTVINVTLNADPKSNAALIGYAKDEGVSETDFKACVEGKTAAARVDADSAEAQKLGIKGTPFSIIVSQRTGKQIIVPGAYPIDEMKKDIDSLVK